MKFVIDASVAVKWYVEEDFSEEAASVLSGEFELNVPELIYPEFGNILWKKFRRGEVTPAECRNIIERFRGLSLFRHSHNALLKSAYIGAEITGQTVYDWTYLSLAVFLNCEMVTADRRFFDALSASSITRHLKWVGDL